MNMREDDDYLHNPDPKRDRDADGGSSIFTLRGLGNLGCLLILGLGLLTLLYVGLYSQQFLIIADKPRHSAGYPVITALTVRLQSRNGGFGLGGINGTGQVSFPTIPIGLVMSLINTRCRLWQVTGDLSISTLPGKPTPNQTTTPEKIGSLSGVTSSMSKVVHSTLGMIHIGKPLIFTTGKRTTLSGTTRQLS